MNREATLSRTEPTTPTLRTVLRVAAGMPASDGAGVKLTRSLGMPGLRNLDPFLMLDEIRSDDPGAYLAGFPAHPHRGFETITYVLAGRMRHKDNRGNEGVLEGGGAQWMTAARGIVHSEMPEQESGLMWGFQLWLNLPSHEKMKPARYRDIPAHEIPSVRLGEHSEARVLAGTLRGVRGPAESKSTEPFFFDVRAGAGETLDIDVPSGHRVFAYVYEGSARFGEDSTGDLVPRQRVVAFNDGAVVRVTASTEGVKLLLIGGRPIGEPIVQHGPFVMNTQAEIAQAFEDYRAGRF